MVHPYGVPGRCLFYLFLQSSIEIKSTTSTRNHSFSCLFVCFISFYILPPPHLANFQPRSSMLQKNLFFPLLYTHRHGKLIPVVFTTILQVMNLLRWPPNAFLFFFFPSRFRYYSLKKEGPKYAIV